MPANIFQVKELLLEERIKTGCSHMLEVDFEYLKSIPAITTTATLVVLPFIARDVVNFAMLDVVTTFDGASVTAAKVDFGYNGATVDDADAFIDNIEVCTAGTELLADAGSAAPDVTDATYGAQELAVLNSLRSLRPWAAQEAGNLELVITLTGGNHSALTAGRLRVFFNLIRLNGLLRPVNL
jgi:hypothetical protein